MKVDLRWTHKDHMLLELLEDINFESNRVRAGFITDGATIPKFLWSILSPFEDYFTSCILHDFLCDLSLLAKTDDEVRAKRKYADATFNLSMKHYKIKTSTRLALYLGVSTWRLMRYNSVSLKLFGVPSIDDYNKEYFQRTNN